MMRRAGTCTPKRCEYQPLMRSRSVSRPVAWVYWVTPSRMALAAASWTRGGAVKSGSPMFRKIIGRSVCATSRASFEAAFATSIT